LLGCRAFLKGNRTTNKEILGLGNKANSEKYINDPSYRPQAREIGQHVDIKENLEFGGISSNNF